MNENAGAFGEGRARGATLPPVHVNRANPGIPPPGTCIGGTSAPLKLYRVVLEHPSDILEHRSERVALVCRDRECSVHASGRRSHRRLGWSVGCLFSWTAAQDRASAAAATHRARVTVEFVREYEQ